MIDDNILDMLVRYQTVLKLVGLSKSTIWRLERCGKFPRRVRIANRAVGWRLSEILQFIMSRSY